MNYELCIMNQNLGGYSSGVPPLPIPNREVKPTRADGTALHRGRVGRRRFQQRRNILRLYFFIYETQYLYAMSYFLLQGLCQNEDFDSASCRCVRMSKVLGVEIQAERSVLKYMTEA